MFNKRRKRKDTPESAEAETPEQTPAPEEQALGGETEAPAPEPEAPEVAPLGGEPSPESAETPPTIGDEVGRLKEQLVRAQAEVVNIQKRMQREFEQRLRYAIQEFAIDIVGVLDHLHRAMEHLRTSDSEEVKGFLQGAELIEKEFNGALARHDVERIAAKGQPFDPDLHDALAMQPSADVEPGIVIEETRAGYKLKDRVIRPAQVIVSRAPDDAAPADGGESAGEEQPAEDEQPPEPPGQDEG
jgi:molecular chaperone GrpE